jgi:uncharacterized protein YndB with AHSA1/START domain
MRSWSTWRHEPVVATDPRRAYVRRIVRAAAPEVFNAWTVPSEMAQWMTPVGDATAEVDLHVGGRFRLVMADEHLRIEHTGEYRVIDPPHLLVFTWRSQFTGLHDTVVTVRLTELSATETELEIIHELDTPDQVASHTEGWNQIVSRLETVVGSTGVDAT